MNDLNIIDIDLFNPLMKINDLISELFSYLKKGYD